MQRIRIRGGQALHGDIRIAGAKNAALPLMCTGLLTEAPVVLENVPRLADIQTMIDLLTALGVDATQEGSRLTMTCPDARSTTADYELVRKMRASVLVLGPLLARFGEARVSLPGGCAIGTRPIDLHLGALELLGAQIDLVDGYVHAWAPKGLIGARVAFPKVSVGATENLLMAASLARGETVLENAAREPEIVDLCRCLSAMGVEIDGIGTDRLTIQGRAALNGTRHRVLPDRIEAGSYAVAAAITGGALTLIGAAAQDMAATLEVLRAAGVTVADGPMGLKVAAGDGPLTPVDVDTQPYPGFATDMQAQLVALMTQADGTSRIAETVFENRFMHVPELARMGADIRIDGHTAIVTGPAQLKGAPVMATDLRASMSLVLAGLAAEGETVVDRVYHLDRGYEGIEAKLGAVGADIERLR